MKKAPRRPNPAALGADSPTSSRVVHSARILGDACEKFQNYCIDGIEPISNKSTSTWTVR
jgi:hypothetical protein